MMAGARVRSGSDVFHGTARVLAVASTAMAGVIGGHALEYVFLVPESGARATILHATGHGYYETAVPVAVLAAVAAVACTLAAGIGRDPMRAQARTRRRSYVSRLSAIQSAGFLAMELTERLLYGDSSHLSLAVLLATGIVVQILAGVCGGVALELIERLGERVRAVLSRPAPAPHVSPMPLPAGSVPVAGARRTGPAAPRAPPSSSLVHAR